MSATLKQAKKILELVDQSGADTERLQKLFPYLSVLLRADIDEMNLNDFRKVCGFKPVGQKRVKDSTRLVVDYSIKPWLTNLTINSHSARTDIVTIDPKKVERVSMLRLGESSITGHEYLRRLKESGRELYDVRVMEEFLKNPEKIPEEWKIGRTYFWGTIFRHGGNLCVACLCWGGGQWKWDYYWLASGWNSLEPAAVAVSK